MIRDRRSVPCLLLILGLFALALPAEQADPLAGALAEAQDLMEEQKYKEAIRAFKKAGELAGGPCLDCHIGLARAYNKVGAHKDALKNAETALQLTKDDVRLAQIYHEQGFALFALAGDDPEKLGQAETAFRLVLEKTKGQINAVRYNLAAVLLRLGRDAEGTPLLRPQVWDKHHEFTAKCTIRGYPTYLLVNHTGEIVFSASGWGPGIERELESKVFFAVRAARKDTKPNGTQQ